MGKLDILSIASGVVVGGLYASGSVTANEAAVGLTAVVLGTSLAEGVIDSVKVYSAQRDPAAMQRLATEYCQADLPFDSNKIHPVKDGLVSAGSGFVLSSLEVIAGCGAYLLIHDAVSFLANRM